MQFSHQMSQKQLGSAKVVRLKFLVVGPSGCGKTTFCRYATGALQTGEVPTLGVDTFNCDKF